MRARENLLAFSILISLLILFDISCNFAPYEGEAKIGIDLGDIGQPESSIDGSRAVDLPQGLLPSDIISVTITISGPDLSTMSTTYALPPRYLYIYVPPGKERTVGVELNVDPNNDIAVLAFGGETTVSLKPGQFE